MEPYYYSNKLEKFIEQCDKLIDEMESLNKATAEGKGKVGYDNTTSTFFSTPFKETEKSVSAFASNLLGNEWGGWIGKKVAGYAEGAYRQTNFASTKKTITALENIRQKVGFQIKSAGGLQGLTFDEKELLEEKIKALKEAATKTKNQGIQHLASFYGTRTGDAGRRVDVQRAEQFKRLYENFDQFATISSQNLYVDTGSRLNFQTIENGEQYRKHLGFIPAPAPTTMFIVTGSVENNTISDSENRDPYLIKKNLEEETLKQKPYEKAPPLVPQKDRPEATWISLRCIRTENGFETHIDQVYSTAERAHIEKQLKKAKKANRKEEVESLQKEIHLPNIKVQNDASIRHMTITCGVIDSELKADEFLATVMDELKKRAADQPKIPVRICLHQLNSFGRIEAFGMKIDLTEGKLINGQHKMSRYMDAKLRTMLDREFCDNHSLLIPEDKTPIVTHDNSAFNIASEINAGEDAANRTLNLEAYATRILWGLEEIQGALETPLEEGIIMNLKLIREQISLKKLEIENTEDPALLMDKKSELKKLEDDFMNALTVLRGALSSSRVDQSVDGAVYVSKMISFMIDILKQVVPTTLEYTERVRVTEVERNLVLDLITGSISEINCKSGLDRTGLARSMWDSLITMYKDKKDRLTQEHPEMTGEKIEQMARIYLIDLIEMQDNMSSIHDKYLREFIVEKQIQIKDKLEDTVKPYEGTFKQDYLAYLKTKLSEFDEIFDLNSSQLAASNLSSSMRLGFVSLTGKTDDEKIEILSDALHYQDLVAYHLMTIALPITQQSTGVVGVKYNHERDPGLIAGKLASLTANPHPLHRLPILAQTESGQIVQIVREGKSMTPACYDLFERLSVKRGG